MKKILVILFSLFLISSFSYAEEYVYLPTPPIDFSVMSLNNPDDDWWEKSGVRLCQDNGFNGEGQFIGIVDTGIDVSHKAFAFSNIEFVDLIDFKREAYDNHGHGTGVAGCIIGNDISNPNLKGVAPKAKILMVKVFDNDGRARVEDIVEAINICIEKNVDIINLSIGNPFTNPDHPVMQAVSKACNQNIIVVTSSGNTGERITGPSVIEESVTVGACDKNGEVAIWSPKGDLMDCIAWGVNVPCPAANSYPDFKRYNNLKEYCPLSGTSFAAPIVSGMIAVLKAENIESPVEILLDSCIDDEEVDFNSEGYGEVKLDSAFILAGYELKEQNNQCGNGVVLSFFSIIFLLGFLRVASFLNKNRVKA